MIPRPAAAPAHGTARPGARPGEPEPLLNRVRSRLHLGAHRAATHLLDGQYPSIHRGRSLDFTDLREYELGDEVGDIDWKATARTGTPLVRRSAAERRHRILFAVDTGRDLAAVAASGEPKHEIAIQAIGTLGWLALRHGDEVGVVLGDADGVEQLPYRVREAELERALRRVRDRPRLDGARSDLQAVLERVASTVRHRTVLVVVAGEVEFDDELAALVARLAAQHELIWLEIADADPGLERVRGERVYDVDGDWAMPTLLRGHRGLRDELAAAMVERRERMRTHFDRHAVSSARLENVPATVPALLRMLKARRHARF